MIRFASSRIVSIVSANRLLFNSYVTFIGPSLNRSKRSIMSRLPKVAVLSFSELERDGRVLRQIEALAQRYEVTVLGYGRLPAALNDRVTLISIPMPSRSQRRKRKIFYLPLGTFVHPSFYERWYAGEDEFVLAFEHLVACQPDVIHANDWEALPVAVRSAKQTRAKVIADLHEYAPAIRDESRYWRWFYKPSIEYFLDRYAERTDGSITVSESIAERYRRTYALDPITVMNVPAYATRIEFRPCNPETIQLVHHGNTMRGRYLETLIQAVALTDARFHLNFMLVDRQPGYIEELKGLAADLAPGRVNFHQPVAPADIVQRISAFDIGFYLLPPVSFNHEAALPNKFFDFIHAGLVVCIGPSLEMAKLTEENGFGVVAPSFDPEDAAAVLDSLQASDIDRMKKRALQTGETINSASEINKMLSLYDIVLSTDKR